MNNLIELNIVKNKLVLENGKVIYLTKEMIHTFELHKRKEITHQEFEKLLTMRYNLTATNMLTKRDYFFKDFVNKLYAKLGDKKFAETTAKKFQEKGFLNDYEYAKSYMQAHSNYGEKKLRQIFYSMGLDNESIKYLLDDNEEVEIEKIKNLLIRMGNKEKDKKISSLMRKGFSFDKIRKALQDLEE